MEDKITIVDKIRALANAQGYSLTTLEAKLELGNGTISRWNKSSPNSDKLTKVADFFHVSTDYLLGRESKIAPALNSGSRIDDAKAAFFEGYADDMPDDEKNALWDDAREYAKFKAQQKKQ